MGVRVPLGPQEDIYCMRAQFVRNQDSKKSMDIGSARRRQIGDKVRLSPDIYDKREAKRIQDLEEGWKMTEASERNLSKIKWIVKNSLDAELEIVDLLEDRNGDVISYKLDVKDIVPDWLRKYSHGYDNWIAIKPFELL